MPAPWSIPQCREGLGHRLAFQEEREALLTSLRNLPSLAPLVDATSIKERTSGCLNGAGTNEKTILSPCSSIITSSPQLLRGIMP